ncbi:MAG: hypothetical protein IJ068_06885 [Bacilli bacterium]|nr:hypothetical protein [Bacilli bacterium]
MNKEEIKQLTETTERSKSNSKRLDGLEKRVEDIHSLTISVKELATELKNMREDMNKIDDRVVEIEKKPSKKLDSIWGYIVSAVVSGLIVFIFTKLGMR